ncbi:hypothetical protein [Pseudomonas fluorescens]|uniref:hypothetical protein n=1 Tax=Pseudomonas fluorescens TaxID=294 RepID=UPI001FD71113|nr:hypothetical protein [Pseudomonas fluorescens]
MEALASLASILHALTRHEERKHRYAICGQISPRNDRLGLNIKEEPMMPEATTGLEKQIDIATKLLSLSAKIGLLIGGTCIVSYLLSNGHYPQGVSIGDSLLFLVAAFCFGLVCVYFSISVTAAGVLLSPLFIPVLRGFAWLQGKVSDKKPILEFKRPKITFFSVFFGVCGAVTIYFLTRRAPVEHIQLILLPIFQYIVYSAYLEQNKKIKAAQPSATEVADAENPVEKLHAEMKRLKKTRTVIAGVILLTPLLMGGVTSDLLQAAMSFAQIRIERATILVKPPYANLLPAPKDSPLENYKSFENATVIFRGVGNSTLIEMRTEETAIRLEIPNDSIIIERRVKPIANIRKNPEKTQS